MRIIQLDLQAFGPFTDKTIDLAEGQAGLHVIYGPNEAGKSSSLRAIHNLLYGIPARSKDDFRHTYGEMRLAGRLRLSAGDELYFVRRKGNKDTLLNAGGSPISDAELRPYLGGLGEDLFSTLFGIGHSQLESGGQEMLRSDGDIGQSIFAASMGVSGVKQLLSELGAEADALYKPRAHNDVIHQALNNLSNTRKIVREKSVPAAAWNDLTAALTALEQQREEAQQKSDISRRRLSHLERLKKALPVVSERAELQSRLDGLGEVRQLPQEFEARRAEGLQKQKDMRRQAEETRSRIAGIAEQLEALEVLVALLDQEETLTALQQGLDHYREAGNDRPDLVEKRDEQLGAAQRRLQDTWPNLPLAKVAETRPAAAQKACVEQLAREWERHTGDIERGQEQVAGCTARLEAVRLQLQQLPPERDAGPLQRVIQQVREQGNLEARRQELAQELTAAAEQVPLELARLQGWRGTMEELDAWSPPTIAVIAEHEDRQRAAAEARDAVARDSEAARSRLRDPLALVLLAAGAVLSCGALLAMLAAGLAGTQGIGIIALAVTLGGYGLYRRLAQRNLLSDLEGRRLAAEANYTALLQEWESLWAAVAMTPGRPREMRSWPGERDNLVRKLQHNRAIRANLGAVEAAIETCRGQLISVLTDLGITPGQGETLPAVLGYAQATLEQVDAEQRAHAEALTQARNLATELQSAEKKLREANARMAVWQQQWATAIEPLGVDVELPPADVWQMVLALEEIHGALKTAEDLDRRLQQIDTAHSAFEKQTEALAYLAPDLGQAPADQVVVELIARLGRAKDDARTQEGLQAQQQQHEELLQDCTTSQRVADEELTELCRIAGCASPEQLEDTERRHRQGQKLQEQRDALESTLRTLGEGIGLEEIAEACHGVDPNDLVIQLEQLEQEQAESRAMLSTLEQSIGEKRLERRLLDGTDEAADAAEAVQAITAALRDDVERYLRLRIGKEVLQHEIERYRRDNQAPVLEQASRIFQQLTLGSFAELKAEYGDADHPVLVGVRRDNEMVRIEGMSDGTVDQLYLALRIGALERYLEGNEPMPFVVDDVLISFDDERTEAALEVFADLSSKTQVVYFTHHERILDLAHKVEARQPGRVFCQTLGS